MSPQTVPHRLHSSARYELSLDAYAYVTEPLTYQAPRCSAATARFRIKAVHDDWVSMFELYLSTKEQVAHPYVARPFEMAGIKTRR